MPDTKQQRKVQAAMPDIEQQRKGARTTMPDIKQHGKVQ